MNWISKGRRRALVVDKAVRGRLSTDMILREADGRLKKHRRGCPFERWLRPLEPQREDAVKEEASFPQIDAIDIKKRYLQNILQPLGAMELYLSE